MSSPPPPTGDPNQPTPPPDQDADHPPFEMEMNFFIPFAGFGQPGDLPEQAAGTGAEQGDQAQPPRGGMMWTFQLEPDQAQPPTGEASTARPQPRSSSRPTTSGGLGSTSQHGAGPVPTAGPVPQRRSGGLPFSGPLNIPPPSANSAGPLPPHAQLPFPLASLFPGLAHHAPPSATSATPPGGAAANPPTAPFEMHTQQMVFIVRPDGSVGQMQGPPLPPAAAHTGAPPAGNAPPAAGAGAGAARPHPFFLPAPQGFMLPFHLGRFPAAEAAPDPEKAKELLKSLPAVERGLMKRVDRIYAAENVEEGGWKCGVCLEGWETEEDESGMQVEREPAEGSEGQKEGNPGVKRLPCNHLFHADCLEPWFGTKHTCPSCRLDLDPLRTLRPSSSATSIRPRPAATAARAERQAQQQPYPPSAAAGAAGVPPVGAAAQPGAPPPPTVEIGDDGHGGQTINFYWDLRGHQTPGAGVAPAAGQDQPIADTPADEATVPTAAPAPVPAAPRRRMGIMPRILASLGGVASTDGPAATVAGSSETRPSTSHALPLPRFEPVSPQPAHTTTINPAAHAHAGHHHHIVPAPPHHHHHHIHRAAPLPHFHIHHNAPATSTATGSAAAAPPADANLPALPPTMFPFPQLSGSAPAAGATPQLGAFAFDFGFGLGGMGGDIPLPPAPRRQRSAPKKPLVQIPLEKWVRTHERDLGWRCDLASCLRAPTNEAGDQFGELAARDRPKKRDLIPIRGGLCEHAYHSQCISGGISVLGGEEAGEADIGEDEVRVRCGECEKVGKMWRWDMEGWEEEDVVEVSCGGRV